MEKSNPCSKPPTRYKWICSEMFKRHNLITFYFITSYNITIDYHLFIAMGGLRTRLTYQPSTWFPLSPCKVFSELFTPFQARWVTQLTEPQHRWPNGIVAGRLHGKQQHEERADGRQSFDGEVTASNWGPSEACWSWQTCCTNTGSPSINTWGLDSVVFGVWNPWLKLKPPKSEFIAFVQPAVFPNFDPRPSARTLKLTRDTYTPWQMLRWFIHSPGDAKVLRD